jgi:hypothetical protein
MKLYRNASGANGHVSLRGCLLTQGLALLAILASQAHGQSQYVRPAAAAPPAYMLDIKTVAPPVAPTEQTDRPPIVQRPVAPPSESEMPAAALEDRLQQQLQSTVLMSQPGDGSTWVHGVNYKASFSTSGFTYIPFLGADSPRNYPIHFAIEGISMGGNAIDFEGSAAPIVEGHVVAFNRGPITEKYLLSPNSVEQTFTVNTHITGDLVIRLEVSGELPMTGHGDRVLFGGDQANVQYTQAVALDDADLRRPLQTSVQDGEIHITLPKAVAAVAQGTLVIDPVITTLTVESGTVYSAADVAYDASTDRYCVAYERMFSGLDNDIYTELFTGAGVPIAGSTAFIDVTSTDWQDPRIANNNAADQFLIVAEVGVLPNRRIEGATRIAAGNTTGAQVQLSDPAATGDKWRPDVGGDPYGFLPTFYLVVWQRDYSSTDYDVHARLVSTSGNPSGGAILIDNSGSTVDEYPAVSNSAGETGRWMVVWDRKNEASSDNIYGAAVNFDGTIANATFPIDVTGLSQTTPSVSSRTNAGTYMVTYVSGGFVYLRVIEGTATVAFGADYFGDFAENPMVDTDGTKFIVTYHDYPVTFMNSDVWIQAFCRDGDDVIPAEGRQSLANTSASEFRPMVCSKYSGGGGGPQSMAVWYTLSGSIQAGIYTSPTYCCPTDIAPPGGNGVTNIDDLLSLINAWGPCPPPPADCPADINGLGSVNIDDLLALISRWGPCP